MKIKIFGQLKDIFQEESITLDDMCDLDALKERLYGMHPELSKKNFAIAVNKKIIHGNLSLEHDAEIALLPPFSGG